MSEQTVKYHVRAANGVTVDMLKHKGQALALAKKENLRVYQVDPGSGKSVRIA